MKMLIQELEVGVLDLNDAKRKVLRLREDEICSQDFRIDSNGKIVRGVPNRNKDDSHRFCYTDIYNSL
jgi:hypothetical protein